MFFGLRTKTQHFSQWFIDIKVSSHMIFVKFWLSVSDIWNFICNKWLIYVLRFFNQCYLKSRHFWNFKYISWKLIQNLWKLRLFVWNLISRKSELSSKMLTLWLLVNIIQLLTFHDYITEGNVHNCFII